MEKILIIDDDPDVITLLQLMLKKKGYTVATALQEQEVLQQLSDFNPDLVLMDVLLSGADGRHICRRLKNSAHNAVPVIMFSAHPGAQKNMQDYGADDFLAKPFQEADLLQKIENQLRKTRQTQ